MGDALTRTVSIPVWALVVVWAVVGRVVSGPLLSALTGRSVVGEPTLGDHFMRLPRAVRVPIFVLGAITLGPWVWMSVVRAVLDSPLRAAWARIRRRRNSS